MLSLLACQACTGPPDEVVIETRVGDSALARDGEAVTFDDLARRLRLYGEIGEAWWEQHQEDKRAALEAERLASGSPDAALEPDFAPSPPEDVEAFQALLAAVRDGPIDEIGGPVRNLAEASPELWPQIRDELLAERERPKREYEQVLGVIGGDVPNRYGYFDLHWKKAHGYDVRLSEDWYEDLLALEPARVSKLLRPVYRELLVTCALLEATTKIAQAEDGQADIDPERMAELVATLLDAAYIHGGTFRDEVGRAIDGLSDAAIPHLMHESVPPEGISEKSDDAWLLRRAEYATYCLDRVDRLSPQRALESVADDRRLLGAVLSSYAEVRDGEAAPLLLDYVDAEAPGVRQAAREAFDAYVVGPQPTIRKKSIRLLGGQTTTRRAELSYREHARLAIRARLEAEAPKLLEPACKLWVRSPEGASVIEPECEAQPERLYRAYIAHVDETRSRDRDARVTRALAHEDPVAGAAMLDTLLSDSAALGDKGPDLLAPFYAEVADHVLETENDRARAAQLLRKSAMLVADRDPQRARELTVDALVLESEVEAVDDPGRRMLLATARELHPDEPQVMAALARLDSAQAQSTAGVRKQLRTSVMILLACLAALSFAASRFHRWRAERVEA
ncbi:hypothetical protein PPSIR1_10260 [Plesiocystis pacifica SIR-1]|uniref:Uncharacterized protein n=1 Tax=Plesiocystis pacifica SIR-1 TaxID=391625 RepID=A6GFF4_9BACT|nr:hypothetical protein PPSIR1_10260 [Plesiocystis pacifica SIR-1]